MPIPPPPPPPPPPNAPFGTGMTLDQIHTRLLGSPPPDLPYENIPTVREGGGKAQRAQARQQIKSLPKSSQNEIRKSLSRGLGSSNANTGAIVWSNLRRLLFATGKKALPFGTALALWELAGRPDISGVSYAKEALKKIDPTARSRNRDRSSETSGYVEERLRQLVNPAPW